MLKQINDNARHFGLVEKYVENDKFRMKYWIGGQGETLLLIHGFGYGSAFNWYPQIEDFSKKYKLIIPDLLCFGDSKLYVEDYSLDIQSEALHLILEKESIDTFDIVAHSYGGFVASNFLANYSSSNVKKLIVINSPVSGISEQYIDSIENEFKVKSIADLVLPTSISELKRLSEVFEGRKIHAPKSLLDDLYQNIIFHNGNDKRKIINYLLDHNNNILDFDIKRKFVVIWGRKDRIFTIRLAEKIKEKYNRNVELYIFNNEGHAPQIDNPPKFNKLVLDILERSQMNYQR
jgi:pimeloyl-ACP methyl ester carboxylesterase